MLVFFDGEGCICFKKRNNQLTINISQRDKKILEIIKNFLLKENIDAYLTSWTDKKNGRIYYKLQMQGFNNSINFLKKIQNKLIIKKDKAKDVIKFRNGNIKRTWLSKLEKNKILKLKENGLGYHTIANIMGRSNAAIHNFFRKEVKKYGETLV
ncbi:MAG: LAGLIDADG family homing endonuclease [candidate division WOR-3 bacterium]